MEIVMESVALGNFVAIWDFVTIWTLSPIMGAVAVSFFAVL